MATYDTVKISSDRLFRRMAMEGVTMTRLASETGISRQALYNIVNQKSQPKTKTFRRICDVLHCAPQSLMGEDERDRNHASFASVIVEGFDREGLDYDIESAVIDYIRNWTAASYNDLDHQQYEKVRAEADRLAKEFAKNVSDMVHVQGRLTVREETMMQSCVDAFNIFFDVIPSCIETEIEGCYVYDIFDDDAEDMEQ